MSDAFSSRLPGFYKLKIADRVAKIASLCKLTPEEAAALFGLDFHVDGENARHLRIERAGAK